MQFGIKSCEQLQRMSVLNSHVEHNCDTSSPWRAVAVKFVANSRMFTCYQLACIHYSFYYLICDLVLWGTMWKRPLSSLYEPESNPLHQNMNRSTFCTPEWHTVYTHTSAVNVHTVGSIWVNECLFFGNTQGCLMHGAYLRLLWFSLSKSNSKPSW